MLKVSPLLSTSPRIFKIDLTDFWQPRKTTPCYLAHEKKLGNCDFSVCSGAHPFQRDALLKVMQTAMTLTWSLSKTKAF